MICRVISYLFIVLLFTGCDNVDEAEQDDSVAVVQQPQIHYSPAGNRVTIPTALLLHNGTYHLFSRYADDSTAAEPLQWLHATSTDLIHWENQDRSAGDSLKNFFPCSVVIDENNTVGVGSEGQTPLVAIFSPIAAYAKNSSAGRRTNYLAYSVDEGNNWKKFPADVVLPGENLRRPQLAWDAPSGKWILSAVVSNSVQFYSSPDLKTWNRETAFGKGLKSSGTWDAARLVSFDVDGGAVWALMLSADEKGKTASGTQYFLGRFDGHQFLPFDSATRWMGYGPDAVGSVISANAERKIFLSAMINPQLAAGLSKKIWRGALSFPQEISLLAAGNRYYLNAQPVDALNSLSEPPLVLEDIDASDYDVSAQTGELAGAALVKLQADTVKSFSIILSNKKGETTTIGFDSLRNEYFIERGTSGHKKFDKQFARRYTAPRISDAAAMDMVLLIDDHSVELFADQGLTIMSATVFPRQRYTNIRLQSKQHFTITSLEFNHLRAVNE